jgi:WD40 repeat protein
MMNPCPPREQLERLLHQQLTDAERDALESHVEACAACQQTLEALTGEPDTPPTTHRAPPPPDAQGDPPLVLRLQQALVRLEPSDENLKPTAIAPPQPAAKEPAVAPRWPAVPGYTIDSVLGHGGMGIVYQARDVRLQRVVALKMLLGGEFAKPDYHARFQLEARAAARLQHPNIVQVYDVGEYQGQPYFTLEFVDGGNLQDRLAGKPQPPAQAARWLATLARAVHYAHEQGIVHRDLKPSNVLVTRDGTLKLCDFGVAKLLTGSDLKTMSGLLVGTPEYMAPEQAEGKSKEAGPAADIHALGAILYTMLTGRPPFQAAEVLDTLEQVRSQEPVPPRRLQPAVPRDVETICLKCLHKEPQRRYASAAALADDLERFLSGQTIQARPVSRVERGWKWAKRQPALAALVALLALVVGVGFPGVTVLWLQADQARKAEEQAHAAKEQQRQTAEKALYFSRIALAQQYWDANQFTQAVNLLAACPEELRNWEWYYLDRLCHMNLLFSVPEAQPDQRDIWMQAVAYSPDGRQLLSASGLPGILRRYDEDAHRKMPGKVVLWNAEKGEPEESLTGHAGATWAAAFSSDGKVAWGSVDGSVWLRDRAGAAPRCILSDKNHEIWRLSFSPNSRWLAIGSTCGVHIWDVAAGKVRRTLFPVVRPREMHLAFDPHGRLLVNIRDSKPAFRLWDPDADKEVPLRLPATDCLCMAFSADGNLLALAEHRYQDAGDITIIDMTTASVYRVLQGNRHAVMVLAFSPDSRLDPGPPEKARRARGRLFSGSDDRAVRIWDLRTWSQERTLQGPAAGMGFTSLAVRPDGKRLACGSKSGSLKVWDLERDPRGIRFTPTEDFFRDKVFAWFFRTFWWIPCFGKSPEQHKGEYLGHMHFASDSRRLLTLTKRGKVVGISCWDAESGDCREKENHPLPLDQEWSSADRQVIAFARDGQRVAVVAKDDRRAVKVWDTASGAELATASGHAHPVRAVALSPDGRRLAIAAAADLEGNPGRKPTQVLLWDVDRSQQLRRLPIKAVWVSSLTFSPDGQRLAVAVRHSAGGKPVATDPAAIEVWDLTNDAIVLRLEGMTGLISSQAFNPAGTKLAAACYDEEVIRVWDLVKGGLPFKHDLATPVTSVSFSLPDGQRLAGTGLDGLVRLWDAEPPGGQRGQNVLTLRGLGAPGSGHYDFTARVVFSPDGRRLAANDWDGTVTIWDAGGEWPASKAIPP